MLFSLGKALRHRESCPYLMHLCLTISSASVGGISKLVVQIPRIDVILMWYWIMGQVKTMISSVIYKKKSRMGKNSLRGSS